MIFPTRKGLLVLFSCALAAVLAADLPQQIHIAFAGADANGDPNGMAVSWQTVKNTATSQVKFGTSPSSLSSLATGTSSTYYVTYDHHVVLKNLQPSTTYYYQCGDDVAGWSNVFSFTTAPSRSTIAYPIRIAMIGDMGMYYSQDTRRTLQTMSDNNEYDWLWHLGDISYADDDFLHNPLQDGYEDAWNDYMNAIQGFVSKRAYMVSVGNHEAECHSPVCETSRDKLMHLSNFTAYNNRFRMPSKESGGNSNMWYSFNYGPVHFINIDTETNYNGAPNDHYTWYGDNGNFWGNQMAWLEADLKQAASERGVRPWIIVGGHRPIYSVADCDASGNPEGTAAMLQSAVEDLFKEYGVDSYWAGHKHSYERQLPLYKGTPYSVEGGDSYKNAPFTVHMVNGAAGNDEEHSNYNNVPKTSWNVMFDATHYGMGVLTIKSANEIAWSFFDSATRTVIDEVTFSKTL